MVLSDGSGSWSVMRLQLKCWLGLHCLKAGLGLEAPLLSSSHNCWPETSVPGHTGLSMGYSSGLTTWQLVSPSASHPGERARRKPHIIYDLASDHTTLLLPLLLFRAGHKSCHTLREGNLAPPFEGRSVREFADVF